MKKSKIAIVYSTPKVGSFIEEYNEKLLKNTFNKNNIKIFPIINKKEYSLSEAYNICINKIKEYTNNNLDEWILLFIHDDITILNKYNWDKILLNNFNNTNYDITGVAGTKELYKHGIWWLTPDGKQMNNGKLYGKVWHTDGLKQWESVFGNSNKIIDDVVTIDGVFIAVNPDNIKYWFDERFNDYHFYDIPFVINNYLEGCNIGVMNNILILHNSIGEVNQKWEENRKQFCELYKDELPIILGQDNNKLNVLICCQFFSNYTGSEMSNFELARELVKQGCNVSLISTVVGEPLLSKAKKAGINMYNIQDIVNLQYYKFDIIHINHKPIGEIVLQYFPNTPAVMHIRSEVIPVFEEPILHNNIKKYISIRPSVKEYIKSFGINEENIIHIDNPFDTNRFNINYKQQKNNKEIILFIGTLDYLRKNILFDLKKQVEKENKILWIIGDNSGNYANELISENVKYFGIKSNVEDYLKKCDYTAGIFTGRSTIEGFLCGKKGYIYTVDKQGNILNKELMDVPKDIEKYSAEYSAKKVIELYNNILNN